MSDRDSGRDFATRLARVATGPHPERVMGMHGGLSLVRAALPNGADSSREGPLAMARLLRETAQAESNNAWTVLWVPPWQPDLTVLGGLYFAYLPADVAPDGATVLTEYIDGARVFFFQFRGDEEANCTMVDLGDAKKVLARHDPALRRQEEEYVDEQLFTQLHRHARAAVQVLNELIATMEARFGEHPQARWHAMRLEAYVQYVEDDGCDTDTVQGALAMSITLTALALGMEVSVVYKMIEERLGTPS